ncbi:putative chaperonin [Besnoitia besnoiti]|uniref:20 kDa chaperonin, chloroplastic n=1 Tax=Besnoitia besnoiti TaxID=94643 RepID=A0A2A9MGS0_BESBE|nr:putative chaperonin [Besnoitia besnoiti]PFH37718.1 putative chaperonin [Besnoitia besnoiti]
MSSGAGSAACYTTPLCGDLTQDRFPRIAAPRTQGRIRQTPCSQHLLPESLVEPIPLISTHRPWEPSGGNYLAFVCARVQASAATKFIPLLDRVLVQKIAVPTKTKSGLFLPDSAQKNVSAHMAKVLAVGKGRPNLKTGDLIPPCVQVGQTVVVPEYGGMKVVIDEQEMQVFRADDLIAVVQE